MRNCQERARKAAAEKQPATGQGDNAMHPSFPQRFAFHHHFALQQIVSEQQLCKHIAADNFSGQ